MALPGTTFKLIRSHPFHLVYQLTGDGVFGVSPTVLPNATMVADASNNVIYSAIKQLLEQDGVTDQARARALILGHGDPLAWSCHVGHAYIQSVGGDVWGLDADDDGAGRADILVYNPPVIAAPVAFLTIEYEHTQVR